MRKNLLRSVLLSLPICLFTLTVTYSQDGSADGLIGDPAWSFKFKPPAGWLYQLSSEGAMLGHNTIPGMILLLPHLSSDMQQMQQEMQEGIQEEGSYLMLEGTLSKTGENSYTGTYTGMMDGSQVKAKGTGLLSPYGGGIYIIAVSTPEMLGDELINAASSISGSVEYIKLDVSDLMSHFAGNWATHTTYTSSYICFCPDGTYSDQYEASYSGDYEDGAGNYEGSWNVTDGDQSKGRWTVRGTKDQGTIIVQLSNGEVLEYEYRVHIEDGYKYYSEYYFNGNFYGKSD